MGIFDEMAARYDTEERAAVADVIAAALRGAAADCGEKAAVDYGCGTGLVGLQLADCFKTVLYVDASPRMVEQVEAKLARLGLQNAATLCADFTAGAPAGLAADVVFMAQVLLHIPDTAGILRRLCALLSPGGRLLVVDFDKNAEVPSDRVHNGFDQAELQALARRAGFRQAGSETFFYGPNLFMGRDASLFLLRADK